MSISETLYKHFGSLTSTTTTTSTTTHDETEATSLLDDDNYLYNDDMISPSKKKNRPKPTFYDSTSRPTTPDTLTPTNSEHDIKLTLLNEDINPNENNNTKSNIIFEKLFPCFNSSDSIDNKNKNKKRGICCSGTTPYQGKLFSYQLS